METVAEMDRVVAEVESQLRALEQPEDGPERSLKLFLLRRKLTWKPMKPLINMFLLSERVGMQQNEVQSQDPEWSPSEH